MTELRRTHCRVLIATLLLFTSLPLSARLNGRGDFQVWNREWAVLPVVPLIDVYGQVEFRFGDNASFLFYKNAQLQAVIKPLPWVDIAPGYRQIWERNQSGNQEWQLLYDPLLDVTLRGKILGWELSDRSRVQYHFVPSAPNFWFFRNKFKIVFPWRFTSLKMALFLAEEVFFQNEVGFNQNRLSTGFSIPILPFLRGDFFYRLRSSKGVEGWTYQNIICLFLGFSF